jgi:hypothetical protein
MRLDFLRALYGNPPDDFGARYVSVYLDTTPTTASAAAEVGLRWLDARERLAAAGADEATLDAAGRAATRRDHSVSGRVIFARGGKVLLEGALPRPPERELVNLAPLPHVMPWLAQFQFPARVPHVRVAADRAGGQVLTVPGGGAGEAAEMLTVEGVAWPVHKASAGGWSEKRFQRSTEETWAVNARRIAATAVAEAERVHAEFVVVGGDVRERSMVLDLLPPPLRESAVTVNREVAADDAAFDAEARAEEERRAAAEAGTLLDELAARLNGAGPGERRAVTGLADTLTALRDGLASDVLLIGEPSWVPEAVWIGPGLADAATERAALAGRGIAGPLQGRADAALARAASGTSARLLFVPADRPQPGGAAGQVADGIAALLRAPAAAL